MTTPTTDTTAADRALKQKHRALWASGDYPAVAAQLIPDLGPTLVEACGVRAGQSVLDVAAGAGNAAIPAALTGADVVATDLTPELFEAGRRRAAEVGATLRWREADAEDLPCDDGEHDVVLSCVGAMFAPHHERTAAELRRVCRPGGTIGMINWTPEGFVGQLFSTMKPYAPPLPPGATPAPRWGSEDHVRTLFAGVAEIDLERRTTTMANRPDPESFREFWKACYGPTIAVYKANAADPERTAALDRDFLDLLTRTQGDDGWVAEYLLVRVHV